MEDELIAGSAWSELVELLPADLESSAREHKALSRVRRIRSASDLLRLVLHYALNSVSTRLTAAWALEAGIADLSWVAAWKRIRNSANWLQWLVGRLLLARGSRAELPSGTVRLVDASVIPGPGPQGTQWRLHVGFNLSSWRMSSVELTGPEGGETLNRHEIGAEEIVVADRGYAHREAVARLMGKGRRMVVRLNWQNFPLETLDGEPFDIIAALEGLEPGQVGDWEVQFRVEEHRRGRRVEGVEPGVYRVRLVACPKDAESTERERRKIRYAAVRKKRRPDPRSLMAAAYTFLVTNVDPAVLDGGQILALYRLRWQVELLFKRLKSIMHIERLPSKDPESARAFVYAVLLASILVETLAERAGVIPPSRGRRSETTAEPIPCVAQDTRGCPERHHGGYEDPGPAPTATQPRPQPARHPASTTTTVRRTNTTVPERMLQWVS